MCCDTSGCTLVCSVFSHGVCEVWSTVSAVALESLGSSVLVSSIDFGVLSETVESDDTSG